MKITRSVAAALLLGGVVTVTAAAQSGRSAYEELQTFSGVLNYIRLNYPDSVSYSELVAAGIRGVLGALDPHSAYLSRAEWQRSEALVRGQLASVGLVLEDVEGTATVLSIVPRSSAEAQGIQAGDRVVAVNDTSVSGVETRSLMLRLAGEDGSKVRLRLERGSRLEPETFTVTVKRRVLDARTVSIARMIDSVTGYLRLEDFLGNASDEVHDALKQLRRKHAGRIILDLRENPGGMIQSAVEIAGEFLPKNTVVFRTRGRKREADTTYVTKRDGDFRDLPLIVLIDNGSASAAEAVAGSLQDHDRALLVGRRTFGKALMQSLFLLPSGDVLWLTIGHVITPSGRVIQRRYHGLRHEQYMSFAGKSGAPEDTLALFRTDAGRPVRGGGGIAPDVELAVQTGLPVWWSAAADSGFDDAVSDSVAQTLPVTPAARAHWLSAENEWRAVLLPPFLARVRERLGVSAPTDEMLERRLAAILATRVAHVRWGEDAREEFIVQHDNAIRYAAEQFPRLTLLLSPSAKPK